MMCWKQASQTIPASAGSVTSMPGNSSSASAAASSSLQIFSCVSPQLSQVNVSVTVPIVPCRVPET